MNGQELELLSRAMADVKGPEYWRFVADRYNELADKLNPGEKEKLKKIDKKAAKKFGDSKSNKGSRKRTCGEFDGCD